MAKREDPRITEAARCRLHKDYARFSTLQGKLLRKYKPTRLAQLLADEELRLQRVMV